MVLHCHKFWAKQPVCKLQFIKIEWPHKLALPILVKMTDMEKKKKSVLISYFIQTKNVAKTHINSFQNYWETTVSHHKKADSLEDISIVQNSFIETNTNQRFIFLFLCFQRSHSEYTNLFSLI